MSDAVSFPIVRETNGCRPKQSTRSHRIDVHRHADETLARLEAKTRLNSVTKLKTPNIFLNIANILQKVWKECFRLLI